MRDHAGRPSHAILFFKPYGVLSQFTPAGHSGALRTLSAFGPFPPRVYAAGRLDADSEGLLLLTDDPQISHRLTDPRYGHLRTYLVQVERVPDESALQRMREGGIEMRGRRTRPAEVLLLVREPDLPVRGIPIRFRKSVPTAWLQITLSEGMNRQVRRMTASAGHPTLRLVRVAIGHLTLGDLQPGQHRLLTNAERDSLRRSLGLEESALLPRRRRGRRDPRH